MEGGVRKKSFFVLVLSNFITFPLAGWFAGGGYAAAVGFILALLIDYFFPTWKYDLSWENIDMALKNVFLYGKSPCRLCFMIRSRRVFVYRDERDIPRNDGTLYKRIRMAVCIPVKEWKDLLTEEDLEDLFKRFGGVAMYGKINRAESYDIYSHKGNQVEYCKRMLKVLFEKGAGGLKPDIFASSIVYSEKNIWIDHGA